MNIHGDNAWAGAEIDGTHSGAIANVKNFVDSIRTGKYCNVAESVESNLAAILGRAAAYQGRLVPWDEVLKTAEKYEANLTI